MKDPALDADQLILSVREAAGPNLVSERLEAEEEARQFLEQHAGRMSKDQAHQLAKIVNRHWWGTGVRHNRFLPALSVPLVDYMVADLDKFNDITMQLWRSPEESALAAAAAIFEDGSELPGSGRSYPSIVLYLRNPERFCIWFSATDNGLAALSEYEGIHRQEGSEGYLDFSRRALDFAAAHGLAPQELDAVLSKAASAAKRLAVEQRDHLETPTIRREAFEFLADIRDNNTFPWFDENRPRYEQDLRDPFAAVLEEVASRYIRDLDPKLNTNVRRDEVIARINKYAKVPYYDFYWGAFSRGKKQEDVQLYVIIHPTRLRFGVHLGSAPAEVCQRLADAAARFDEAYLSNLAETLPGPLWETVVYEEVVPVTTPEELASWALGPKPEVAIELAPDDPLIGSPDLVDVIGRTLVALYPLAASAWGDEVDLEEEYIADDEPSRPEYPFEKLVAETGMAPETLEEWIELLGGPKRAALFYGPPGTGKTFVVERLAKYLAGTEGDVRTIQFHPSFSYEDFVEGLRPEMNDGQLSYVVRDGVFKDFCDSARGKSSNHVFVIDEINRAELGAVLGEVMMLIEYRGRTVPLPYSQEPFSIPKNVVLLATMNTADRSLALVDFALRRRFHAFRMPPSGDILAAHHGADGELAVQMFELVQGFVADEDFSPGHSYWMDDDVSAAGLERIWRYELRPYLQEYWFESRARLEELEQQVLSLLAEGS